MYHSNMKNIINNIVYWTFIYLGLIFVATTPLLLLKVVWESNRFMVIPLGLLVIFVYSNILPKYKGALTLSNKDFPQFPF